ncbi:type II CAAX endopeptidase family protein [Anaeromyxobacter paludicola]|uniref:CAAX prenyl protease 2/Lysostaphin resistance protein A-like domain-containing protein n=1 Tax=Anaeromyxobacter paludicola TaxID=2918171 RepID=A0ABN6N599_9BACT|nr:type II CAAX endopeptidase family protein [Anaeromyxobacter paludicola]BDG07248.1 hypothetical protein AMPC_03610 [Anaeromyxobacter paludicola]
MSLDLEPGGPAPHDPPPPPPEPERRAPGVAGFFVAVLLLYALPGALAQAASASLGLAWSELFAFLLPAALAAAGANLRPGRLLGLDRAPPVPALVLALLCGVAGFLTAGAVMALTTLALPASWVKAFDLTPLFGGPAWHRALLGLLASLLAPVCEEAAFRGYVQRTLLLRLRPAPAIGVTAVLFAAMHLDPVRFPALVVLGLLFGWLAWRAGSIWPAVAAHAVNNAIASLAAVLPSRPGPEAPARPLEALALLAGGALWLAALAAFYARLTPAPPAPAEALAPADPSLPSGRFALAKIPFPLRRAAVLGLVLLGLLGVRGAVRSARPTPAAGTRRASGIAPRGTAATPGDPRAGAAPR